MGLAGREAGGDLVGGHRPARASIERRAVGIVWPGAAGLARPRFGQRLQRGAALEARIDEPHGLEPRDHGAVVAKMLGLATVGGLEGDAEPGQVLQHRRFQMRRAAGAVDILDAQQQASAEDGGQPLVLQSAQRMAEMEQAVGARREAQDGPRFRVVG